MTITPHRPILERQTRYQNEAEHQAHPLPPFTQQYLATGGRYERLMDAHTRKIGIFKREKLSSANPVPD